MTITYYAYIKIEMFKTESQVFQKNKLSFKYAYKQTT